MLRISASDAIMKANSSNTNTYSILCSTYQLSTVATVNLSLYQPGIYYITGKHASHLTNLFTLRITNEIGYRALFTLRITNEIGYRALIIPLAASWLTAIWSADNYDDESDSTFAPGGYVFKLTETEHATVYAPGERSTAAWVAFLAIPMSS